MHTHTSTPARLLLSTFELLNSVSSTVLTVFVELPSTRPRVLPPDPAPAPAPAPGPAPAVLPVLVLAVENLPRRRRSRLSFVSVAAPPSGCKREEDANGMSERGAREAGDGR